MMVFKGIVQQILNMKLCYLSIYIVLESVLRNNCIDFNLKQYPIRG